MADVNEINKFLIISLWVLSIFLVIVVLYRLQKEAQSIAEQKVKLKEDEIEKRVHSSTLDELIDLNNKDRKG